jgi:hypothetical protein
MTQKEAVERLFIVLKDSNRKIYEPMNIGDSRVEIGDILKLPLLGIFRCNWRKRTILMHGDASALEVTKRVWTIGIHDSGPTITVAYEDVGINYATAADYWKHGEKIYERD